MGDKLTYYKMEPSGQSRVQTGTTTRVGDRVRECVSAGALLPTTVPSTVQAALVAVSPPTATQRSSYLCGS